MLIQTSKANFLIEKNLGKSDCVKIKADSKEELQRYFGSSNVQFSIEQQFPFQVLACKQEFANALILMVKEIEYSDFGQETYVNS